MLSIRRRRRPAAPTIPVPSKAREEGSGTAGGGVSPPFAATFPVLPFVPAISAAKKYPPALPTKSATVTPPADVTVNTSGPAALLSLPPLQAVQVTDARKLPKVEAVSGAGPIAKPEVRTLIVIGPAILNSKASPAPVPA